MLAGVLGAGAIALGIGAGVATDHQALDRVDAYQRVLVSGTGEVKLTRDGSFTIYYEAPGVGIAGATRAGLPSMRLAVQAPDGTNLPLRPSRTSSPEYELSERDGVAVATFRAPEAGRYRVSIAADVAPGRAELAIGSSLATGIVGGVLVMWTLCMVLLTGGVALILITAIRRYHHNHPHVPAPPYAPPPPPPYTYPPPGSPSWG